MSGTNQSNITKDDVLYVTLSGLILDAPMAQVIGNLDATINQQGIKHLYLAINTPGGSVSAGINLYHYLKGLPVKVTTHNVGQVDSIGNIVFLSGDERVASSATTFMLHGVKFSIGQPTEFTKSQLKERYSQLEQDEARISAITVENTKLTPRKVASFFTNGRSLNPTEAKEYGIISDIREFEIPDGAKRGFINAFPAPNN